VSNRAVRITFSKHIFQTQFTHYYNLYVDEWYPSVDLNVSVSQKILKDNSQKSTQIFKKSWQSQNGWECVLLYFWTHFSIVILCHFFIMSELIQFQSIFLKTIYSKLQLIQANEISIKKYDRFYPIIVRKYWGVTQESSRDSPFNISGELGCNDPIPKHIAQKTIRPLWKLLHMRIRLVGRRRTVRLKITIRYLFNF